MMSQFTAKPMRNGVDYTSRQTGRLYHVPDSVKGVERRLHLTGIELWDKIREPLT